MVKKINYIYFSLLAIGFVLLISEYSFTWNFLNYFLTGLIVLYPTVLFFRSKLHTAAKIMVTVFALVFIGMGLYGYAFVKAFGEHEEDIQSWKFPGYTVVLKRKIGWSGPPYKEFDLYGTPLFGIIGKNIASVYYDPEKQDPCVIQFSLLSGKKIEFNKCSGKVSQKDIPR